MACERSRRASTAGLLLLAPLALLALLARAGETQTGGISGQVTARPSKWREGVVVWLDKVPGSFRPPAAPIEMDQKGMTFIPHVLPALRGATVRFLNSDAVRHNVFSPDGEKIDLGTWPRGETRSYTFKRAGVYRLLCNVHPEMSAFVVVRDNPFFAVTDAEGRFQIHGIPPGAHTVHAWSEKLAESAQPVTVSAGVVTQLSYALKKR